MLWIVTNSTSKGLPDQHFVQERRAACVIVGVDETGDDGHSLGVEGLRPLADQRPHVGAAADRGESRAGDRERFRARYAPPSIV